MSGPPGPQAFLVAATDMISTSMSEAVLCRLTREHQDW
jgi:hypothetical protein